MIGAPLARHDLVDVEAGAWAAACAAWRPRCALTCDQAAAVEGWAAHGRPAIGRRALPGDPAACVGVGVPLPPTLGKLRVALSVPVEAVRGRPSTPLAAARQAAPPAWETTNTSLEALGRTVGITPAVYGALLWQHLTGLPYLHPGSDLDLLWLVGDPGVVAALLSGLTRLDEVSPVRLDGELLTPAGGVNWRELATAWPTGGDVLAKTAATAVLRPATSLFEPADR